MKIKYYKNLRKVAIITLPKEIIKEVEEYEPNALVIRNEKDEEVFRISISETPSISKYGICFHDTEEDGKMYILLDIDKDELPKYRNMLVNLTKIENQIFEVSEEMEDFRLNLFANIEEV